MSDRKFLDTVYDLDGAETTRAFYDAWSDSYDREVADNGYATPGRIADALLRFQTDRNAPVLDLGCGTGISGAALRAAGFSVLDGSDFSAEMLALARAKGIYRKLMQADMTDPMPFADAAYATIAAVGVLNPGHAPAAVLDDMIGKLPPGGVSVFSLNDHALADPSYEGRMNEHLDAGSAVLLFREHGAHLPKIDLESSVYVLRKT
ncbi:MAG: methyltransferase domain-containing protein [Pseudomonadota bacterium]